VTVAHEAPLVPSFPLRMAEHGDPHDRVWSGPWRRSYVHYDDHMAKTVTATHAKATILALLDEVAAGEEVEITKRGRTVARLVPAAGSHALKGSFAGVAMTAAEDEALFTTGEAWEGA
jgi:prevent-host-death family protein